MIDEQDLVLRCQKKEQAACKLLYETYADYLYSVCYRYAGERYKAEDWMHDGFVKILTQIDRFKWRGEGSLTAWIFSVQHNIIISHLRKERHWIETIPIEEIEQADMPEPETTEDIPKEILMQMIAELPIGYRTVFNLYVLEGYPHRDIAQLLGIQEKTSSSQLSHARRILAARIIDWRKNNL